MLKLLILLAATTVLAFLSQQRTERCLENGQEYHTYQDLAYILLVVILVLFAGLRTRYNDTENYIGMYKNLPSMAEFFQDQKNRNIFRNPLFYFLETVLKGITANPQWLIFLTSLFTQICFVRFFKRYSSNFTFTMFLYITYETFCFSMAALKQVLGMAMLTIAIPYLERKKWVQYYLLVFVAMLLHTYALVFAVLPFFTQRPWKLFTFLVVGILVFVVMNFEEVITSFMDQANELGKTLTDEEVFDDHTINTLRLMVYAVIPVMSLIFCGRIFVDSTEREHLLVHMSILSLAFMSMGTQAGANMFARMATYFELGTLCCLPWMIDQIFEKRSYRLVLGIAAILFFAYFYFAFGINMDFNYEYKAGSILRLLHF